MERPRSKITFRESDRRSQLDAPADADWTAGRLVFETDCTPEAYTYSAATWLNTFRALIPGINKQS